MAYVLYSAPGGLHIPLPLLLRRNFFSGNKNSGSSGGGALYMDANVTNTYINTSNLESELNVFELNESVCRQCVGGVAALGAGSLHSLSDWLTNNSAKY